MLIDSDRGITEEEFRAEIARLFEPDFVNSGVYCGEGQFHTFKFSNETVVHCHKTGDPPYYGKYVWVVGHYRYGFAEPKRTLHDALVVYCNHVIHVDESRWGWI